MKNRLSIQKISIRQIKAARALLDWSQEKLASQSGISAPTIRRLEAKDGLLGGRVETRGKILATLEKAGVRFLNAGAIGVRLEQRVTGK